MASGSSLAHYTSANEDVDLLRWLKDKGADLNLKNQAGHTPFYSIALMADSDVKFRDYIRLGMDPNITNKRGEKVSDMLKRMGKGDLAKGLEP